MGFGGSSGVLSAAEDQAGLLTEVIGRHRGRLNRVAHDLGISRRWVYYLIERLGLWPVVNRVRRDRITARRGAA